MNSKMKKLVTTMMGAMLVTITAIAQVTPMVLGDLVTNTPCCG